MHWTSTLLAAFFVAQVAAKTDPRCGKHLVRGSSGWLASPSYAPGHPASVKCEWVILAKRGHLIETTLTAFGVPPAFEDDDLNGYIKVFDTSNEDLELLVLGSQLEYGQDTYNYRSESNMVIVQFLSDPKYWWGFNATYASWNAVDFCDTMPLLSDRKIQSGTCNVEGGKNFSDACSVTCNPGYKLTSSSRVTCRNGIFTPQFPCEPILEEVKRCYDTDLEVCIYSFDELAEYEKRREDTRRTTDEVETQEIDLDIFPDPWETGPQELKDMVKSSPGLTAQCIDNILNYSYCVRTRKFQYAFKCASFLTIKNIRGAVAARKVEMCRKCRGIDCRSAVYI